MKIITTSILMITILNCISSAQKNGLYESLEFQNAISNETRTRNGEPGAKYWQNSSDYKLEASINTSKNMLKGKGSVLYHNNSPTALHIILFRLYQNLYKAGSPHNEDIPAEDINEGMYIESLKINGIQYIANNQSTDISKVKTYGTDLSLLLKDSIPSGSSAMIELEWNFSFPTSRDQRMGRYANNFFVGLWYPQIAVYDDIVGWDISLHLGLQEFYNDFNNFDVTIKVPKGYVVWATGESDNLKNTLTNDILQRLTFAKSHDSIVSIISPKDYQNSPVTGNNWHFKAEHVPDFAFAAATNYLWKGSSVIVDRSSGKRVFIDIIYPADTADSIQYANSLNVAKEAILWSSNVFPGVPFPYVHVSSFFNGTKNGSSMEFPMLLNDDTYSNPVYDNAVVVHELYHNYMPFYMGFNETLYGWMDEGWAEFLENKFKGDSCSLYELDIADNHIAGTMYDSPLITSTIDMNIFNTVFLQYIKPTTNLLLLEELMGEEAFSKATKAFMKAWNGKHPTPMDFFYTFSKFADKNINWFWKACYFEYGYIDLAIKSVEKNNITIEKKGSIPVSIKLDITYDDNSHEKVYKNLNIWEDGATEYVIELKTNKPVRTIILGDKDIPDVDLSNNIYQR